jgi:hypothetical protein
MNLINKPCFEFHYEMFWPAGWDNGGKAYSDGKDRVMRIVAADLATAYDALKAHCLSIHDEGGSSHYSRGLGQCQGLKVKRVDTLCEVNAVL